MVCFFSFAPNWVASFRLVNTGSMRRPIFLFSWFRCFLTSSHDFWSLKGTEKRTIFSSSTEMGCCCCRCGCCCSWTNLFTVVSKSDIGYWSFLKITLKRSISLEKSCHEEESLNPLYSMVLRRDFLYLESTWLWKWSRSPLSVGFLYTSVWRTQPLLMIRIPKKGRLSSTAVSIVNSNDGWVSFSTRRKDSAASMLFAMARVSSTYLL